MTMWLPRLESRRGPVYRAIADALDEDVQNGTLRAGMRLPPHRDLADHLGVTVTTITRAYAEAARRGLTSGYVGRGTYIRGNEAEERGSETTPFDLSIQHPDARQRSGEPAAESARGRQCRLRSSRSAGSAAHPPGMEQAFTIIRESLASQPVTARAV